MARKSTNTPAKSSITVDRASRLYLLVSMLEQKPQTRDALTKKLNVSVRDFYRDLEALRSIGVPISFVEKKYKLEMKGEEALGKLPFPIMDLTLSEAEQLSKGRTNAHKKMTSLIDSLKTAKSNSKKGKK